MIVFLLLLLVAAFLFYWLFFKPLYYWDQRHVPNVRGWPVFGKQAKVLLGLQSPIEWLREAYNEFPDKRYSGTSQFNRQILVLRDPELIKRITIKDFNSFVNRIPVVNKYTDPLLANTLLFQKSEEWRTMRCTLSPAFTSGKMRSLFELVMECADQFTSYFVTKGSNTTAIESKGVLMRFTNDMIASCGFGVKCDSLRVKDNEFYLMGQKVSNNGRRRILKVLTFSMFPWITKVMNLPIFPDTGKFFAKIVTETLDHRKKNGIVRCDMLHLMNEARKGTLQYVEDAKKDCGYATAEEHDLEKQKKSRRDITQDDITAQCTLFFFAAIDPLSTAMAFMLHELAVNKDIQERLREEVERTYGKCGGKMTYEALLGMKYLDMVVSESLRKWPGVPFFHRVCTEEYTIPAECEGEKDLLLKPGQGLIVSITGIHRDPKYYPNPEKFDPERFSEVNKDKIVPYTYLPFGQGRRNCIASRLALLSMKTFAASLLANLEIVAIEKTPMQIKLKRNQLTAAPDVGFWVGIKPRKSNVTPYY